MDGPTYRSAGPHGTVCRAGEAVDYAGQASRSSMGRRVEQMPDIAVGDKYKARPTARNSLNGINPGDDIRIGFVESAYVSVRVIRRGGSELQLAVPIEAFGVNFEDDKFHVAPPNRAYALSGRARNIYR